MRSPKLAALELKRFGRGRLPRAAMAAMLLLPLLYGALYLWSFWYPYQRLDKVPVALVNEDRGAKAGGERITRATHRRGAARQRQLRLARDRCRRRPQGSRGGALQPLPDRARRLQRAGRVQLRRRPRTGALKVRTNDANNYIVGQISRTVFSEVRAAASRRRPAASYDKIFVSFSTMHDRTEKAAEGADQLGDGIGRAKEGTGRLKSGLGDAGEGSGELKDGTGRLHDGAGKLKKGSKQVAAGTQKLSDKVDRVAGRAGPFLDEHGDEIGATARSVARTSKVLKDNPTSCRPRPARRRRTHATRPTRSPRV